MAAETDGVHASIVWHAKQGEARDLAVGWVDQVERAGDAILLLGGGEATVTVRGDGIGGRNTEFALAAALELERRDIRDWTVASLATDGQDALTGVAGAIASAETIASARALGLDPDQALETNDSLAVFDAAGGAVKTGPTGTNVNDIYIALRHA
jgi:hydroxypyruvate reductase